MPKTKRRDSNQKNQAKDKSGVNTASRRDLSQKGKVPRKEPTRKFLLDGSDEDQIDADLAAEQEEFDEQNDDLDPDLSPYILGEEEALKAQEEAEEALKAQEEAEKVAKRAEQYRQNEARLKRAEDNRNTQNERHRKAREEAALKAEEARKAQEEADRQAEEARKAQEEADRQAEEARRLQEEVERQAEAARIFKEALNRQAEAARILKEEQAAKKELLERISTKDNGLLPKSTRQDWLLLTPIQQNQIVETAYQSSIVSDEKRNAVLSSSRPKKGTPEEKEAAANKALAEHIESAKVRAINDAISTVKAWAEPARLVRRQAQLGQDKTLLTGYINGLNANEDNADVKAILIGAVSQLSFSNMAFGSDIPKSHTEADIKRAAYRWNRMEERVNGLQLVTNMHVPGGSDTGPIWKERGKNLEKTKNLVAKADGVTNNVHLHTTGTWKKPK